jgi:aminoglycoside phosphotransferase
VEIGQRLGAGNVAEVFAYGDHVAKLWNNPEWKRPAFNEAANLVLAAERGLPVPIVHEVGRFDGRWGIVMSRAPGRPMADEARADPATVPLLMKEMLSLHRQVHAASGLGLPDLKARLAGKLAQARPLAERQKAQLTDKLLALPRGDAICHGDFHPFNIIREGTRATIIDWLDATCGPATADVCRTYLILGQALPDLATAYVEAYAAAAGLKADDILVWLPILAGARLTENVPGEDDRLLALAEQV